MNHNSNRNWRVMTWNVRGINSAWKWDSVKNKIQMSHCDIICLQETKKENFEQQFIKKICPTQFDCFDFLPSVGTSGGILIAWKGSLFTANNANRNPFGISMDFLSRHNNSKWSLMCVYAPCSPEGKEAFIEWFKNIQIPP
jgi:exonuclease III